MEIIELPNLTEFIDTSNENEVNDDINIDTEIVVDEEPTTEVEETDDTAVATFNVLKDKGVLREDATIKNWEDLDKELEQLPNKILENVIEQAPDITKKLFQFAFTKGTSLSNEDLKNFMSVYLEEVNRGSEDIDTIDKAREILTTVYKEQGFRQKVIDSMLDALEDEGLEEIINEAKEQSKKTLKTDNLINDAKKELEEKENLKRQFVTSIKTELDKTGWKPKKVNTILTELTSNNINTKLNDIYKNPKALIQLVDFLSYYKDNYFDLTNFINQGLSNEVSTIKKNITKDHFNSVSINSTKAPNPNKVLQNLEPII
jgi:hypothetical protein